MAFQISFFVNRRLKSRLSSFWRTKATTSNANTSSVQCGDDADNVCYDEKAARIYVRCGNGALAVLDAKTGSKLADIKLSGHPESFERSGLDVTI